MRSKCEERKKERKKKAYLFGSTKIALMQFSINNKKNGSLVHGKFIMTRHWHNQPNVCSNL
jgi:hypothetical protein